MLIPHFVNSFGVVSIGIKAFNDEK